jgi:hypothetical protein
VGTTEVDLYDVMSPTSGLQGYKALSQIDCQEIAVPFTLQRIAYFSAKDVQGLLNSALPAHFNYSADKFCKDQGFDRAGTLYTTEGTANEGSLTTVANYEIDSSGAYYIASQSIAFPEAVVCTLDK